MLLYIILRKDFRLRGKKTNKEKISPAPQIKSARKEKKRAASVQWSLCKKGGEGEILDLATTIGQPVKNITTLMSRKKLPVFFVKKYNLYAISWCTAHCWCCKPSWSPPPPWYQGVIAQMVLSTNFHCRLPSIFPKGQDPQAELLKVFGLCVDVATTISQSGGTACPEPRYWVTEQHY